MNSLTLLVGRSSGEAIRGPGIGSEPRVDGPAEPTVDWAKTQPTRMHAYKMIHSKGIGFNA